MNTHKCRWISLIYAELCDIIHKVLHKMGL